MIGYAYVDAKGIGTLHVVGSKETALEFTGADGKIKEVNMDYQYGYPVVDGVPLVVYADGREKNDNPVPQSILDLVNELK